MTLLAPSAHTISLHRSFVGPRQHALRVTNHAGGRGARAPLGAAAEPFAFGAIVQRPLAHSASSAVVRARGRKRARKAFRAGAGSAGGSGRNAFAFFSDELALF